LVRAGAAGVLPADIPSTALVAAVRAIAADVQVFAAPTVAAMLAGAGDGSTPGGPVDATAPEGLTDREREVLVQLGRGLTNAQIAQQLRVSETTVKTHVGHVLAKLGLRDRAQAVVFVYESGLIRPGGPVGLPGVSAG
jgi:DNA-binding NarL/FixJ family response regulator